MDTKGLSQEVWLEYAVIVFAAKFLGLARRKVKGVTSWIKGASENGVLAVPARPHFEVMAAYSG